MGVRIDKSIDLMAYKVVRVRGGVYENKLEVLTGRGWIEKKPTEQLVFDETMLWDYSDLEELVTEVQKLGIKPKDASYTEGLLVATQKHLEDMRLLTIPPKSRGKSK
jgi:hypothetical protein